MRVINYECNDCEESFDITEIGISELTHDNENWDQCCPVCGSKDITNMEWLYEE